MITELDYTIAEAFSAYQKLISDYTIFVFILASIIVFAILIHVNFGTSTAFYLTFGSWLLLIVMTFYFRKMDMINQLESIFTSSFYQNIFFYYWNTIFGVFIMHNSIASNKLMKASKQIILLFYVLVITTVIFSFYITGVVNNQYLLVLGNIYPMIIIGNILLFILYLYLIILKLVSFKKK